MKKASRGGKGGEEEEPTDKKQENLGEKLRKVVGKRGGQFTPVLPFPSHITGGVAQDSSGGAPDNTLVAEEKNPSVSLASARKLGATVWELEQYNLSLAKMHHGGGGGGGSRNHRHNHHHQQHNHHRRHLLEDNPDPSPASPDLGSASSLRRHVAASLMQHHWNRHAIQPLSPASYGGSSMEVAPYNPVATPASSVAGTGEPSHTLKTSTELLKVLNRIWSLEEQHAAHVSLVGALKAELDSSRATVKELVRRRQSDRHELEDERKLRKRSETLHRKLARELHDSKTALADAMKDLEKERRSRRVLEDLCDEFAVGIKTYERELQSFRPTNYRSGRDGLILHISESWLDERMQTRQETKVPESSVAEKLGSEIEAFLDARRRSGSTVGITRRRSSLESIPLNLGASAPRDDDDDKVSSAGSDSHCFELDKPVSAVTKGSIVNSSKKLASQETANSKKPASQETGNSKKPASTGNTKKPASQETGSSKKLASQETGNSRPEKFEEQMARAILRRDNETKTETDPEAVKIAEEGGYGYGYGYGSNSKYMESLIRNHLSSRPGNDEYADSGAKSLWKSHPSPVREWATRLPMDDLEISESSTKEQNTLKSKLQEARTRGQKSRSRLKANK